MAENPEWMHLEEPEEEQVAPFSPFPADPYFPEVPKLVNPIPSDNGAPVPYDGNEDPFENMNYAKSLSLQNRLSLWKR